jgi:hypothetical protein
MKKITLIALTGLMLTGCAATPSGTDQTATPTPTPTVEPITYSVPADCNVEGLIKMAPGWESFDQTDEDVKDQRDCAVGTPNSDVGVFFGYNKRTDAEWASIVETLKTEGYEPFDAQVTGADVWRLEDPSIETGPLCRISGHVGEVSFSATEPWVKCDDDWNRELATLLVDHSQVSGN